MKVFIDDSDYMYSMAPAKEREDESDADWAWYLSQLVEIPDEEWQKYDKFLDQAAHWHRYLRFLHNQVTCFRP